MARKHPSNMLDEDGRQRGDMEALLLEVPRVEALIDQAENLVGYEFSDTELEQGPADDKQKLNMLATIKEGMLSSLAVAQDCIRYMREEVLPSLTDEDAIEFAQGSVEALSVRYRTIKKSYEAFCTMHGFKIEM
ncbi:MAG: hypothetical protein VX730_08500 [Pseudomonadota bacterium]|nr:hypothetical protein [Pseudomonadota bacterium]